MIVRQVGPVKNIIVYAHLIVLACAVTGVVAQGDNDVRPPENVRIVRERSGESNDRLVAKWDAPSSGNVDYYWFRWRSRESGGTDWGGWNSEGVDTNTSETLLNLAGDSEAVMKEYQVGLRSIYNGRLSDEVTATWRTGRSSKRSRRTKEDDSLDVPYVPKPAPKTCELLSKSGKGISVSSPQGLGAGIQCQQIGAAGIGVASVIEAGFVDAVDVWGVVATAEVCFGHNEGEFLFLDASTAPRSVTVLPCASRHRYDLRSDRPSRLGRAYSSIGNVSASKGRCVCHQRKLLRHNELHPQS